MLRRFGSTRLFPSARRSRASSPNAASLEHLEPRQLLSAVSGLSDEFDDPSTLSDWQRVHQTEGWNADQLDQWDIGATRAGQMSLVPNTVSWYQDYRGPLVFKEVTGDFVITTRLEITDRDDITGSDADDVPSDGSFSLGGVMIRTPRDISSPADWIAGSMADDGTNDGENYVFLSMGHGAGVSNNGFTLEVKTTRNSDSQLELTPLPTDDNAIIIQTARIGSSVITLYQRPGEQWRVHRRYSRADLPETLQVGLVSYSDYGKVSTYSPFYHNGHRLGPEFNPAPDVPFSPDVNAGFDYARFAAPAVPVELEGVDLVSEATDEQLLSFLGHHANVDPNGAEQVPQIGDQTMNRSDDLLSISLPSTINGDVLSWEVAVLENVAADLQSAENLSVFRDDFGWNWGGLQEKWLQGDDGYVYLLPNGEVWRWNGSFATSQRLAELSGYYYEDPVRLTEATAIAVTASVQPDATLVIDPAAAWAGTFQVRLQHASAEDSGVQVFAVQVVNQAPEVSTPDDVSLVVGTSLLVDVPVWDADGDEIVLGAIVVGSVAAELRLAHGLYDGDLDQYALNWGGQQEKWIRGEAGWYFLMPTGQLYRWEGSFADSVLLGEPGVASYEDPQLLLNAVPPDASVSVSGHQLVIEAGTQTGEFRILVNASDGVDATAVEFGLTVTNTLPALSLDDLSVAVEQEVAIELPPHDADGHDLTYTAQVVGTIEQQLDQLHGFQTSDNYYTNWGGQHEKWVRNMAGDWFYLLEDGRLYRWAGSFASSELLADLDASVYLDPARLTDPVASDLQAAFAGHVLQIATGSMATRVTVRVIVSDGFATLEQLFDIDVTGNSGLAVDSAFADGAGWWL